MNQQHITRRSVLTTNVGAAHTACGIATAPTTAPAPSAPLSAAPRHDPDLALLEHRYGGRIGVRALDTGSGATMSLQGRERFLTASTAKLPLAAAVLDRATTGMTVADLCDAFLTVSHNTATNLPLGLLGGPTVVSAFAPGLDDATTRFHRNEPQLNVSTGQTTSATPPHRPPPSRACERCPSVAACSRPAASGSPPRSSRTPPATPPSGPACQPGG
ncbi:hypothetical protein GTY44_25330 [Streptomyces sp. SID5914]|nr:serine hydrolase [Streptomyces sp. SID5914]MZG16766.1 hypothetical protein [Streptomyces sp. SID5914]